MAVPYALRTVCGSRDADVKAWIVKQSPRHVIIKHEADTDEQRPHWHALMWSDKTEQNLRVQLTKAIPELKGNKGYSMKKLDVDRLAEYERYICHASSRGDEVIIISAATELDGKYSKEWAAKQNKEFYDRQDEYKKKQKKSKTPRQVAAAACTEKKIKELKGIAEVLVEAYREAEKPMNVFHMRSEVRLIYVKMNGEKGRDKVVDEILGGIII